MTRQYLLEVLNCRIVVKVVVVLERRLIQRIGRAETLGMEVSRARRRRIWRVRCQTDRGKNQQHDGRRSPCGAIPGEEEDHARSV